MGNELPKGWRYVKLSDLAEIQSGGTPSRSNSSYWNGNIPWVKISDIKGKYITETEEFITEEGMSNSSAKMFERGTIIFSIFATIGKVAILDIDATTNQALVGLKNNNQVDKTFLVYALTELSERISNLGKGVAQKNINISILKEVEIPLPPLEEQKQIAEKLNKLFDQIESIKKSTKRIPELLKNFRQQILTYAVTGKLTEDWRKDKHLDEWRVELAKDCCEKVQSGGTPKGSKFETVGIPFLKVYNIVNNKIDFESEPQYVSEEIQNSQIKKSITYPGDVIMNIVGPPLNKVAIIPDTYKEWNLNQAITLFRPKEYLNNKYLYYFFCEGSSVNSVIDKTRGVVGQVNISLSQCRDFSISIPPMEEQLEIVKRIEVLFNILDDAERRYQLLCDKLDKLPQALLCKAFKGKLV
ncbi:MAG: restriction endonuclease subunit S [Lachnospiraceae bacterium]|nr:restriction endonuclease subunit S [Lachnospiraceae bacterium]